MSTSPAPSPDALPPASATPSPRKKRRWPRRLAWLLLALLVAVLLALEVLWRWAASPGSLAQALAWAEPHLPPNALQIDGLQGSLLHGGQADKLRWSQDGLTVEVTELRASWRLLALLRGKLHVDELGAARIRVDDARPPSDAAPADGPPQPLELPLRVEARAIRVGAVELAQPGVQITGIAGSYRFDQLAHHLNLDSASVLGGRYSANVHLGNDAAARVNALLRGEFGVQALQQALPQAEEAPAETAEKPAEAQTAPRLLLRASVRGPMRQMQLTARLRQQGATAKGASPTAQERNIGELGARLLRAEDAAADWLPEAQASQTGQTGQMNEAAPADDDTQEPRADLVAQITPWAAQPVASAQASFARLDLAPFWPAAPQTRLSGEVRLSPVAAAAADAADAAEAEAAAEATQDWRIEADLSNGKPGPWNAQRLPVQALQADVNLRAGPQGQNLAAFVNRLQATLGGGTLRASGHWLPAESQAVIKKEAESGTSSAAGWLLDAVLDGINPAALHTALLPQPLSGYARASAAAATTAQGALPDMLAWPIAFDVDVQAAEAVAHRAEGQPAPALAQGLARLRLRQFTAQGRWLTQADEADSEKTGGQLDVPLLKLRAADAELNASDVQARLADLANPASLAAQGKLAFTAPGLKLALEGSAAQAAGKGQIDLQAANLAQTLQWLHTLPALPANAQEALTAARLTGRASLRGQWQGGWADPAVKLALLVPALEWRAHAEDAPLKLQNAEARATGRLRDATLAVKATAQQAGRRASLNTQARIRPAQGKGKATAQGWQAAFSQLDITAQDPQYAPAPWRVALQSPFTLTLENAPAGKADQAVPLSLAASAGALAISPVSATTPATLAWEQLAWADTRWSAKGKLQNVPLAWAALIPGDELQKSLEPVLDVAGSAVFAAEWDGEWNAARPRDWRLQAAVERTQGDLILPPLPGAPQRQSAGLQAARVSLNVQGQDATARLLWQTRQIGQAEGELQTQLAPANGDRPGVPEWPLDAPLQGHFKAQLPRVAAWSLLAPPGWRLRGALDADIRISGTRSAPQWSGQLGADGLALRSVADGFELKDGELRARLQGEQLVIDRLTLQGGGKGKNANEGGGTVTASGQAGWAGGQWSASFNATLGALRPSIQADRQIALSGQLRAAMQGNAATLDGQLRVDQAHIELPDDSAPTLDDDVVIHRADGSRESTQAKAEEKQKTTSQGDGKTTLAAKLGIDLGPAFTLRGQGMATRLTGQLQVAANGPIGALPRVTGEIRTEGGTFRAYGQQLQISKGVVRFNGAADNPVLDILALRPNYQSDQQAGVRVTGTALLPSVRLYSKPELSASQTLAWLLLGRAAPSGGAEAAMLQQAALAALSGRDGKSMASRVGLDELSLGEGSGSGSTSLTVGKRLSDKIYATYEQTLGSAMGTLFIYYELSRRWLVRGQAGEQAALDVIYRISYD